MAAQRNSPIDTKIEVLHADGKPVERLLLQAVKTVQAGGDPQAADASYYQLRAVERILDDGVEWRDAMLPLMYPGNQVVETAQELAAVS